jgi:hypothetical protein
LLSGARINVTGNSAGTVTIRVRLLLDGGCAGCDNRCGYARTGVDVNVTGDVIVTNGGAIQTLVQEQGVPEIYGWWLAVWK